MLVHAKLANIHVQVGTALSGYIFDSDQCQRDNDLGGRGPEGYTITEQASQNGFPVCHSVQKDATFGARSETQFNLAKDVLDTGARATLFQMEGESTGVVFNDSNWGAVFISMMWIYL